MLLNVFCLLFTFCFVEKRSLHLSFLRIFIEQVLSGLSKVSWQCLIAVFIWRWWFFPYSDESDLGDLNQSSPDASVIQMSELITKVWCENMSSSVGLLVILLAHKSFPALADKWTWWPARSFPSLPYMIVRVEALEHHCCCLLLSQLASGKESVCQWLGEHANWLWVVCWLRRPLLLTFIACRNGPLYYLNPWLFGDCWALRRPGDNSLVLYSVLLPFKFEV